MSELFWCLLVDIETCEKDLAKLVLVSVEDQRDTPSPLSADSPSPSPVFLTSPQHHSSSSSACSLSSSGSDIVRLKDFYLPFNFWWHHQVLLHSSQFNTRLITWLSCVVFSFIVFCFFSFSPRSRSLPPTVLSTSIPSPWPPFTQWFRWLLTPGLHIQQALSTTLLRSVSVQFTKRPHPFKAQVKLEV